MFVLKEHFYFLFQVSTVQNICVAKVALMGKKIKLSLNQTITKFS